MLLDMNIGVYIVVARGTVVMAGRKTVISRRLDFKWESDVSQICVSERLFWLLRKRQIGGHKAGRRKAKWAMIR